MLVGAASYRSMPHAAPGSPNSRSGKAARFGPAALGSLLFAIVALSALWVVFVAGFQAAEMLVGALSVAASVAFLSLIWRTQQEHVLFHVRDVAQVWRVPGQVAGDAVVILRVLWQDLFSRSRKPSFYEVHRFDAAPRCAEMLGRELLAVAYLTASPNSIVLGVDEGKRMLMVHQLTAAPAPELGRRLGMGARL